MVGEGIIKSVIKIPLLLIPVKIGGDCCSYFDDRFANCTVALIFLNVQLVLCSQLVYYIKKQCEWNIMTWMSEAQDRLQKSISERRAVVYLFEKRSESDWYCLKINKCDLTAPYCGSACLLLNLPTQEDFKHLFLSV